jgi:glycosyltransferase involved in cell wall biosynthesis
VRVAVILPAYQEAGRVGGVVRGCLKHTAKVLVVDDCSPDCTSVQAAEAGAEVIRHTTNRGKGAALKTGFGHLLVLGFTHAIAMDADGQHDPECIPGFIAAVTAPGVLLVLGNRFNDVRGMPFLRRITNRLMSWLISLICRTPVPDSQCGFRLVRLDNPVLYSAKADHFEYESEVLILTARAGGRIVTVPVPTTYGDEQSKIRPWADTKRFLLLLLRL